MPTSLKFVAAAAAAVSLFAASLYGAGQTPAQIDEARSLAKLAQEAAATVKENLDRIRELLTPPPPPPPPGGGDATFGVCGENMAEWHGDVVDLDRDPSNGIQECFPGHEHGDPPPQWLIDRGINVIYGGDEATPNELVLKPEAYKGFEMDVFGGQKFYLRFHAASTPHDRAAQFHSYEFYLLDGAGNLSRLQGWYDTGLAEFPGPHRPSSADETELRPIIGVVDQKGWDLGRRCEQWYANGSRVGDDYGEGWGPDLGFNFCGSSTIGQPGEHLTAHDRSTWVQAPDTNFGAQRRIDVSFYKGRGEPPVDQVFYATQFGIRVSGPMDPVCGTPISFNGRTYTQLCLPQYIASTHTEIGFSTGNSWVKTYSVRGVVLGN